MTCDTEIHILMLNHKKAKVNKIVSARFMEVMRKAIRIHNTRHKLYTLGLIPQIITGEYIEGL